MFYFLTQTLTQEQAILLVSKLGVFWLIGGLALPELSWDFFQKGLRQKNQFLLICGTLAALVNLLILAVFCIAWSKLALPSSDWDIVGTYILVPFLPSLASLLAAFFFQRWKKSREKNIIEMVYY